MFGNMDNTFIQERLLGLQQYLNSIIQEPMFVRHESFKRFMDPKNYPANMQGLEIILGLVTNTGLDTPLGTWPGGEGSHGAPFYG